MYVDGEGGTPFGRGRLYQDLSSALNPVCHSLSAQHVDTKKRMADHDEDAIEGTPGYVPPAKVGLEEMKSKDADDEALNRWKAKLLEGASAGASSVSPPSAHFSMLAYL